MNPRERIGTAKAWLGHRRDSYQLLLALPRGAVCAEIGVWRGDNAAAILRWTRPRRLHLIDPWQHRPELPGALYGGHAKGGQAEMDAIFESVLERFAGQIKRGKVNVIRASSDAVTLPAGSLDWAYIDGDHHYAAVKADLEHYSEAVRPGGYLAGDDYLPGAWFKDSVRRAVDEFAESPRCQSLRTFGLKFLIKLT